MVTETKPKEKSVIDEPKFRNPADMTTEQLTDPDYRLKQVVGDKGVRSAVCSKCHHCR